MATHSVSQTAPRSNYTRSFLQSDSINWLFLLPAIFFFLGWQLYPLIRVFYLSFTRYRYLTGNPPQWVGLQNYIDAVSDPIAIKGIWRALMFTGLFLPGIILIPLVLAIMLDRVRSPRIATFYRVILLMPSAIPGALIMMLWVRLFDFSVGPINSTLIDLGIFNFRNAPQWMGGTTLTIPAMVIIEVWWGLGYHTMFFLAGLAMIPRELTEAARIDGATEWQLFRFVTVPRLYPILSILVVLRFGTAMAVIEEYLLIGGGANNRGSPTYTWTVYMWNLAFKTGDWLHGYASAIGWIGAIFMIIVVVVMLRVFRVRD